MQYIEYRTWYYLLLTNIPLGGTTVQYDGEVTVMVWAEWWVGQAENGLSLWREFLVEAAQPWQQGWRAVNHVIYISNSRPEKFNSPRGLCVS